MKLNTNILFKLLASIMKLQYRKYLLVSILLFNITGCFLFDDSSKPSDPIEEKVAPIALFSLSQSSGLVSLSVSFIDQSTSGTSPITTWAWDFGDGGTSQDQNPQHIFETVGTYDVSLTVTTNDGQDTSVQTNAVTVNSRVTEIKLIITGTDGRKLEGVAASSDIFTINNQQYNTENQLVLTVSENESSGVIHLSKPGYVDRILYMEGVLGSVTERVTLLERGQPIIFDANIGGNFTARDGANLQIFPGTLIHQDGTLVTGNVELYINPVDISDRVKKEAFPGSFFGIPENSQVGDAPEDIASYGAVEMSLFQNSEKLQLRENTSTLLEIPIYVTKHLNGDDIAINDVIPLWVLNEGTGIWEQQGTGKVINNSVSPTGKSLLVTTAHFSWFNTDIRVVEAEDKNNDAPACELIMTVLGAEHGNFYTRGLRIQTDDQPIYAVKEQFRYVGQQLSDFIPSKNDYEIFISGTHTSSIGEEIAVSDSKIVRCAANDPTLNVTFDLKETPLRLIDFYAQNFPVLELVNGSYQINKNSILVIPYFEGADTGTITSELLDTPISLASDQSLDIDYFAEDSNPSTVGISIAKNEVSIEETLAVQYVSEQAPQIILAYAYHQGDSTVFTWKAIGADFMEIFSTTNSQIIKIDDSVGQVIVTGYQGYEGDISLIFSNQYGESTKNVRVGQNCIPDSDFNPCPL